MLGQTHKLNDSHLYLMHDLVETLLVNAKNEFAKISAENKEELANKFLTIAYFTQELQLFEADILGQHQQKFNFSVEELYYMFGQYDNLIGIEFHKFSDAAKKYGRNLNGVLVYGKNERQLLENTITSENIPRTNSLVKIDVAKNNNLTIEQSKELIEVGFNSGDIHKILYANVESVNQYIQKGKKDIPNSINIDFDPTGIDPCKMSLHVLELRLEKGSTLIENDWNKYFGYNLCYLPEIVNEDLFKSQILNKDGTKKEGVRFYELVAKKTSFIITKEETSELSILLRNRTLRRLEILKAELRKSNINSLEKFKLNHPEIYSEIYLTALVFDDEALTIKNSSIPIYWDFKSYLHIYLRHCDELQPSGHFKAKTPFSYNQNDIRRILKIAVRKLEDKIQDRLSQGLEFRTYGEKALYFNGNYYSMRIESSGRIDSFHPHS